MTLPFMAEKTKTQLMFKGKQSLKKFWSNAADLQILITRMLSKYVTETYVIILTKAQTVLLISPTSMFECKKNISLITTE